MSCKAPPPAVFLLIKTDKVCCWDIFPVKHSCPVENKEAPPVTFITVTLL